jgi:Putative zinc-finger
MKTKQHCDEWRLADYVDGDLSGHDRIEVSRHLEGCAACTDRVAEWRQLGEALRETAARHPVPEELDGLAGGVVSRSAAERAESWRGLYDRATEDWRWCLVGCGSLVSACLSVAFVYGVLAFGPKPERHDSLSGLLSNRGWQVVNSPGGSLYVWASPVQKDEWARVRGQIRSVAASAAEVDLSLRGLTTEDEFVGMLSDALTGSGKPIDLEAITPSVRRQTGALLAGLKAMRKFELPPVYHMQLVTNTQVTAKGF